MKSWIDACLLVLAIMSLQLTEQMAWAGEPAVAIPARQTIVPLTPLPAVFPLALDVASAQSSDFRRDGVAFDTVALSQPLDGAAIGPEPAKGFVRLPGHVLTALQKAHPIAADGSVPLSPQASAAAQSMELTLVLRRDDEAGFQHYLAQVYDPQSKRYRHFLTQTQLTRRYGPSHQAYRALQRYLARQGFTSMQTSNNRMTLTVRGTRAQVEKSFALKVNDYGIDDLTFYANDRDPALPHALAGHVASIGGLSDLSRAQPAIEALICGTKNGGSKQVAAWQSQCRQLVRRGLAITNFVLCTAFTKVAGAQPNPYIYGAGVLLELVCGIASLSKALTSNTPNLVPMAARPLGSDSDPAGTGQTIGLLEFDGFNTSDVQDYLTLTEASASQIGNLSVVPVNGGIVSPGTGEGEVLLDIDAVMTLAPGAKVAVYEAPFNGRASSYSALFNAMIDDGVNIISNSWASCEDQVSQADAQAIDSILQGAAASGISVFNGSGDSGSTCLDGSANTIAVPADSPHATAVGSTSLLLNPGFSYGSETWWDGSGDVPAGGQGGFGVSRYFSRPSYQDGVSSSAMRSVPDVSIAADPFNGMAICQADNGGCPNGTLNGGTSLAAPEWAAIAASLNQMQGRALGDLNTLIYPLAGSDAFNAAVSIGSDFARVGLGTPNINALNRLLAGGQVGTPDATMSTVTPFYDPDTATVQDDGSVTVPADGTSSGGVRVVLRDVNGYAVKGKTVSLTASGNAVVSAPNGSTTDVDGGVSFLVTDLSAETVNLTATDSSDSIALAQSTLRFGVPPPTAAGLNVFPTTVAADGSSATTISVTLQDTLGRPTPGKTVAIAQSGGHSVISGPTPAVTDSNGQIQFTATDQTDETVTYTAVDVTDGDLPIPGTGTVTFSGAGASDCTSNPPVGVNGYVVTTFATGFAAGDFFYANVNFGGCPGALNPAFDPSGAIYVSDFYNGNIYKFDANGGSATPGNATTIPALGPSLTSLVYGKDGSVYSTLITGSFFTQGAVVQIDPATGTILRTVASGYTCPTALSVDPLSGDLFFVDGCFGAGSDNPSLWRISDPANTDPDNPTTVSVYATLPYTANGEIAFAPNGTIYVTSGNPVPYPGGWFIEQVSGTDAPQPATVTTLSGINSDNSTIAIGKTNANGSAQTLVVHETAVGDTNGGALQEVDITTATPSVVTVLAIGDIGIGTIGPDGCNYVGAHHNVYKLAPASGNCGLTPSSPGPALTLSPASVANSPAQGTSLEFTATLKNLASPAGVPVRFTVSGANPQVKLINTDANGQAVLRYVAVKAGTDTIVAAATVSSPRTTGTVRHVTAHAASRDATPAVLPATIAPGQSARAGVGAAAVDYPAAVISADTLVARAEGFGRDAVLLRRQANANTSTTTALTSNPAQVTWIAGKHSSFVTLNPSPSGATAGQTVTVIASLADVSASPVAAVSGQTVQFSLDGASCSANTDATGLASCQITVRRAGRFSLTVSFAGSAQLTFASDSVGFNVVAANGGGTGNSGGSSSVGVQAGGGGGAFSWPPILLLGLAALVRRRKAELPRADVIALVVVLATAAAPAKAADNTWLSSDRFYMGLRGGALYDDVDVSHINQQLAARGYSLTATVDRWSGAGSAYVGYQLNRYVSTEFSYTYSQALNAQFSGAASASNLNVLLKDSAEVLSGYGDTYALSLRGRLGLAPRLSLDGRIGVLEWDSKVKAEAAGSSATVTHCGGGITVGAGLAYRLWQGLDVGAGADYLRARPNDDALLYAASLEWHFGH